ncbi:MAG TPA: tetratricopeptide repeat protein, partial [Candidatus Baltobacteraceae bacterium]|nr:tetratricopeptide repeat protein [Candidatus Baltobacteraceae bacterium]
IALSHENVAHVTSIVTRLDGLPLAIELVAARANLLTLEGMAKRIHDLDAFRQKNRSGRHQTVTDAVRWSYELLAAREQLLMRRLAVFDGPFDIAAIEAICSDADILPEEAIFPVLSELVEASLVCASANERADEQRYALLETVRQFLRALPDPAPEALRGAHAAFFAERAAQAELAYENAGTSEYVALLRRDEENMDAALAYAWESRDALLLGRFVSAFARLWPPAEMKRRHEIFEYLARDCDIEQGGPAFQARVLVALGAYASTSADWHACKRFRSRAAQRWREAGDEGQALFAESMIAYVDNYLGASLADETMPELYRIAGRLREMRAAAWHAAVIEMNLASMELSLGRTQAALSLALSALAVARSEKRANYVANSLAILAKLYLMQDDVRSAERCIEEAIEITEDSAYAVLRGQALSDRARLRLARGDAAAALRSCAESLETYERAYELRYVARALSVAMEALLALGEPQRAARIAGYVLSAASSTGTVAVAAAFEASPACRQTREVLGEGFAAAAQLGATLTYRDLYNEVAAASSSEDDSRTIRSL